MIDTSVVRFLTREMISRSMITDATVTPMIAKMHSQQQWNAAGDHRHGAETGEHREVALSDVDDVSDRVGRDEADGEQGVHRSL